MPGSDGPEQKTAEGITEQVLTDAYFALSEELRNYIRGLCGSAAVAEEIVQETFVRTWEKRTTFEAGRPLRPFLYKIAQNLAFERFRKERNLLSFGEVPDSIDEQSSYSEPGTLHIKWRIYVALSMLAPKVREAYLLARIRKCTIRQIARIQGISEVAAKVRIHRAREKLTELLADLKKEV